MSDTTKAMIFMFLGLLVAILLLGYHKSPKASAALGAQEKRGVATITSNSVAPAFARTTNYTIKEE